MQNKVIDITATNITTAPISTPQISANVSFTGLTASTTVVGVSSSFNPQPEISASVSFTGITTSVSDVSIDPVTGTQEIQTDVNLTGYGEDSLSNYGSLFLRPSQWLHIANIVDIRELQYEKTLLQQFFIQDSPAKTVGVADNFIVGTADLFSRIVEFSRRFFEGGSEYWYFGEDYTDQPVGYAKPFNHIELIDQKFIRLNKRVVEILPVVAVDTKLLESPKLEFVNSFELVQKGYDKLVLDTVISSDDVFGQANLDDDQYVLFIKVLYNQVDAIETFSQLIEQPKFDSVSLADPNNKTIDAAKPELLTAVDQFITVTVFSPLFTDNVISSDDFLGAASPDDDQYIEFLKVLSNDVLLVEQAALDYSKLVPQELVTSSEINTKDLEKLVLEVVRPTDDFLGAANLDDDQYVVFVKQVEELAVVQDIQEYLVDFKRIFVDVPVALESAAKTLENPKTDALSSVLDASVWNLNKAVFEDSYFFDRYTREDFSEDDRPNSNDNAPVFQLEFNLLESSQALELISFVALKDFVTPATSLDIFVVSYTTPKIEAVFVTETRELLVAKDTVENLIVADFGTVAEFDKLTLETVVTQSVPVVDILKQLTSQVSATDDFLGQANIDDDQIAVFIKVLEDTVTTSEFFDGRFTPTTPVYDGSLLTDVFITDTTKVFEDSSIADDEVSILGEKVLESLVPTTLEQIFDINKVLVDAPDWFSAGYVLESYTLGGAVFYETFSKDLLTTLAPDNLTGVYEAAPIFNASKVLVDLVTNLDQISIGLEFNLLDQVLSTDDFFGLANLDDDQSATVGKVLQDFTGGIVEQQVYFVEKTLLDTGIVIDQAAVNLSKILEDQIFSTDDFFGLANLDDDQVATVGKVLNISLSAVSDNAVTLTDTFRIFSDVPLIGQEVQVFSSIKGIETTATLAEEKSFDSLKPLQDAYSPQEESAKLVDKQFDNSGDYVNLGYAQSLYVYKGDATTVDVADFNVQPVLLETTNLIETLLEFNVDSALIDQTITVEQSSKELLFNLLDNLYATDDFFGSANIDDDQYALFIKALTDVPYILEQQVYFVEKTLLDTGIALEQAAMDSSKVLSDIADSIVDERVLEFTKTLDSSIVTAELLTFLLVQGRSFLDAIALPEEFKLDASKVLEDNLLGQDLSVILLEKPHFDSVTSTHQEIVHDYGKSFIEPDFFLEVYSDGYTKGGVATVDLINFGIQAVLLDTANLVENMLEFDVQSKLADSSAVLAEQASKSLDFNLLDILDATDDFFGSANLDDDQYSFFIKALNDQPAILEQQVYFVEKTLLDTGAALEQAAMDSSKVLSDIADSIVDERVLEFTKTLDSSVVTAELLTFLLVQGRSFLDAIALPEELKFDASKVLEDISLGQDLSVVLLEKPHFDSVTSTHQELVHDYDKSVIGPDFFLEIYSDGYTKGGVATAEYVYKTFDKPMPLPELVTVLDPVSNLVSKPATEETSAAQTLFTLILQKFNPETITTAEELQRVISKVLEDVAGSSEAATALLENYLPPQFAQAGYVGTNFTL